MSVYQVPVNKAIRLRGATEKACILYQHLQRLRDCVQKEEEVAAIDYNMRNRTIEDDGGGEAGGGALLTPPAMQGMTATMVSADLDNLPAYVNLDSIKKSLLHQNRNSITQADLNSLKGQVRDLHYMGQYKTAFKAAAFVLKPKPDVQNIGKHGEGIRSIVKQINNEMLSSPNDRMLKMSTVYNAVQR